MSDKGSKVIRVSDQTHRALKVWAVQAGMQLNEAADALIRHGVSAFPANRIEPQRQGPADPAALPTLDDNVRTVPSFDEPARRWRLEGQYSSEIRTLPFFKVVENGITRWEDDHCAPLSESEISDIEHELSKEKPKIRLKEIEE